MEKDNNQLNEGKRAAQKPEQENSKRQKKIRGRREEKRIRKCAAQGDGTCDISSSSSHSLADLGTAFRIRRDGTRRDPIRQGQPSTRLMGLGKEEQKGPSELETAYLEPSGMLDGASVSPQQACFGDSPRSVIAVDISISARKVNSRPATAALVVGKSRCIPCRPDQS